MFNLFTATVTPVPQPKTTTQDLFGDYVNPATMPPPGMGGDYFDPMNPPIEDPLQLAVAMFAQGYKQFLGVPDNTVENQKFAPVLKFSRDPNY